MTWKPTEEQLARARAQIAAEKRKPHKPTEQKQKPKRAKRNRRKKPKQPDYISMQYWQRFGPGGME